MVLNKSVGTATLVDLGTGKVRATLPTGVGPHEVAVSPDGVTAVVCNYGAQTPGSTLTVIDLTVPAVRQTIDLGECRRPHGIAFLPDGKRVVVTAEAQRALVVVHVESGQVEKVVGTD